METERGRSKVKSQRWMLGSIRMVCRMVSPFASTIQPPPRPLRFTIPVFPLQKESTTPRQ